MKLLNENWDRFELELLGYQYPEAMNDKFDSNWLMVKGDASMDDQSWSFTDPCLLTMEVAQLAEWFALAAKGEETDSSMNFVKPNPSFEIGSKDILRVNFELEARPPWAPSDISGQSDQYIDFEMDDVALLKVSNELSAQLTKFPFRDRLTN